MESETTKTAVVTPALPAADEILAENNTCLTRDLFGEAFQLTFNTKPQHQIIGIGAACVVFGVILLILQLYAGRFNIFWIPFLCMGVFILFWGIRLPKKKESTKYRIVSAGGIERKILFYEDHMEILIPGKESEEGSGKCVGKKYSEIDRISETDHVLLFVMNDKSGVIVEKAGFLTGDTEFIKKLTGNQQAE